MAFKGLRFAGLEWKNITASKVMWVVIAAIGIMPLLYGALYLAAFQDPYARLNTVPVAVVNEDQGAVIATEQRNLGEDVVDELKNNDEGLEWNFVSADEAQKGLEDGTYYMVCTIPTNFSESVASAETSDPEKAQLLVNYNQSENMLASQIGQTVWKEVRTKVSGTVSHEYWNTVLNRVADSGKDIQAAADGAGTLKDGLAAAHDGSQTITTNLGTLSDGATSLDDGLAQLFTGTITLKQGTLSLVSGANQLKAGTGQVAQGAGSVAQGASQLKSEGTGAVSSGASQVNSGVQQMVESMGSLVTGLGSDADSQTLIGGSYALQQGIAQVNQGAVDARNGVDQINAGVQALSGTMTTAKAGLDSAYAILSDPDATESQRQQALAIIKGVSDGMGTSGDTGSSTMQGALGTISSSLDAVSGSQSAAGDPYGLTKLIYATSNGGAGTLGSGAATLHDALSNTKDQLVSKSSDLQRLSSGASQLDDGASEVDARMTELAAGASQLSSGASQVDGGASSAVSGASQLDDGASQLLSGTQSAKDGSAQIASGASQLEEGSATLTTGLSDAVGGSSTLQSGLAEGAETAAEQTSNIDGKADVMGDPVELVDEYYTTVKNYGTGFAPYFMALGLWVGGLVAGFVFKPLNKRLIISGGNPVMVAFSNYLPMAVFALIQATLLMVVLQFGLQLQIDNVPAFYAMGYLTALVFTAIMQFLMAAFGFPGKFVAIILLMLQLTASAGTFPIQTTPDFFQAINPYMPMSYVVQGMRQIMTGLDYGTVGFDCFVLAAIGIVCFALTAVVAYRKRTVRMDDLHPVLQLG